MTRSRSAALLCATAVTALTAAANAGTFSTVNHGASNEPNHKQILTTIYGGAWSQAGVDYTNGQLTVTRVFDDGVSALLNLTNPAAPIEDKVWSGGEVTIIAKAKYAGDSHTFGWIDDTKEAPVYAPITSTTNYNAPITLTLSDTFRWGLKDLTTNRFFTSNPTDNIDNQGNASDHLVTYRVSGLNTPGNTYLLFWEDRIRGQSYFDYDYNDAVIEITAVPAPGPAALAALGGLMLTRRRRS